MKDAAMRLLAFVLPAAISGLSLAEDVKTLKSQQKDQVGIALTVYSNGRSLVRDRRRIQFEKGTLNLEIQDVSAKMRAETAQFKNVKSPSDLAVLEQNFEFDLLSPATLLEKFVGKKIDVIRTHPTTGVDSAEPAEVLSVQGGTVLKVKDRIETGLPARLSFPSVPSDLRAEPTLALLVDSKRKGEQEVELNYLSDGISWKADYIADLNEDENRINLTGFVTLTNQSGTSFSNAQLQLMGGEIQTVDTARPYLRSQENYMAMDMVAAAAPEMNQMQGEAFFEYHLYSLPRATTILSNQTKQVNLLQAADVVSKKEIIFSDVPENFYGNEEEFDFAPPSDGSAGGDDAELGTPIKGSVFLSFENDKQSRLGLPLPAGTVRVYKRDKTASSQFIGEDKIRHTPEEERVRIRLGNAFDVTARKRRVAFKNVPPPANLRKNVRVVEFSKRVTFKNAKAGTQEVIFRDTLPGEAKITNTSRPNAMLNNAVSEWTISIPSKGKAVLNYTVRAQLRR
jgi:hypothetical protein